MAESLGGPETAKRLDLRLVPVVMVTWSAALVGGFIDAVWSALLAGTLGLVGTVFLVVGRSQRTSGVRARTLFATLALACVLGAVVAVHCAVTAGNRENGPLAQALAADEGVVIHILVTGSPTPARSPGHLGDERWIVDASLIDLTSKGSEVRGIADIVVTGGAGWQKVRAGQSVRTTGTLKQVRDGRSESALLSASSDPIVTGTGFDVRQTAADIRKTFVSAAEWLPPDAAGLLPGMVTGDTSSLPESLETAMKTTGMTHLTAVSGANCSLILGGFILLARCFRLVRPAAGAFAACGLLSFVMMVGPDPSVLRAAVMGAVGLAALTGGLRGRSLTFLCLATTILLLLDPAMAVSVGFLLSVLATLGIVLLATRIASWIPSWVPRWLAAGIAVPLSAQLLCGPVIVALQPQFTSFAFIANVVAGPLVAPVTIFGTIAVPLATLLPWLAVVPIAVSGTCAGLVAAVARLFAGLPGAALPWAEGPVGIVAMVLSSLVTLLAVWMALHPAHVMRHVMGLHGVVMVLLERCVSRRHGRLESCKETSGRNPTVAAAQNTRAKSVAANTVSWRDAAPAAVVLIMGPEEYLGIRALDGIRTQVRTATPDVELSRLNAGAYEAGSLAMTVTPSLFGEGKLIEVEGLEAMNDAFLADGLAYLQHPDQDVVLVLRHAGGVRGKKLLDAVKSAGWPVIDCQPLKKDSDKTAFVVTEFRASGRRIEGEAVQALVNAVGANLSELAAACNQLIADATTAVTAETVERYYGGRVEATAFKVADAAMAGNGPVALSTLRHALATGVDPVPLVAALAAKLRTLAKVAGANGSPATIAKNLGMQPWLVEQAQRDVRRWTPEGLIRSIQVIAEADAQVKGESRDPVYAVEHAVTVIATSASRR